MEENDQYKRAQERVQKIRGFYSNLITFVWVNLLLMAINLISNPHDLWFYWVTLIWGIVLIVQAIKIFTIKDRFLGDEWEKKKIQEILNKENNEKK